VEILGMRTVLNYYIMHIQNSCECVDEKSSIFEKYRENDPVRPDKAGQYSGFVKLVVDTSRSYPSSLFRVKNANLLMIIDELTKEKVQSQLPNSGMLFIPAW
jgi:hypothetical protein